MTVQTFDIADALTVTPAAAAHFAKQLLKKSAQAVRVSLKEAGCTGYKYVIDEVEAAQPGDMPITLANGVVIYLDSQHLDALRGMVIDYTQQGLNYNLVLNNPNVKEACGCGESFNV